MKVWLVIQRYGTKNPYNVTDCVEHISSDLKKAKNWIACNKDVVQPDFITWLLCEEMIDADRNKELAHVIYAKRTGRVSKEYKLDV